MSSRYTFIDEKNGRSFMQQTRIRDTLYIAVFAAIIAVMAQLSIPMPGGVPMTLQTLAVPLAGIVLGARRGTISTILYLLLGIVGVPVFANFTGGPGVILSVTGGFLMSFPIMAWMAGCGMRYADRERDRRRRTAGWIAIYIGLISGAVVNYIVGMIWFTVVTKGSLKEAFVLCVLPVLPTALIKIIIAGVLGVLLRSLLIRAHVLELPQGTVADE